MPLTLPLSVYFNKQSNIYDFLGLVTGLEAKKEETPEDKIKSLEKKVNENFKYYLVGPSQLNNLNF